MADSPLTLTGAELAWLLSTAGTGAGTGVAETLGIPASKDAADAGYASLAVRGLVEVDGDEVVITPAVAAVAKGLTQPTTLVQIGLAAQGVAEGAVLLGTDHVRFVISPRAAGCYDVAGLDASGDVADPLVAIGQVFLDAHNPGIAAYVAGDDETWATLAAGSEGEWAYADSTGPKPTEHLSEADAVDHLRKGLTDVLAASVGAARRRDWHDQPRDPGGENGGQWLSGGGAVGSVLDSLKKAGSLGDVIDDDTIDAWGGDLYVGLREDGVIDLGIGTDKDGPVGRIGVHDVDAVTDAMFGMWRKRDDEPVNDDGLIHDTIVGTAHDRIYVGISSKEVERDDETDVEPVLTIGVPTEHDSDETPDFHEIDLVEEDFDQLTDLLQRFRDDYEPEEIDSTALTGNYDALVMADHTVHITDGENDAAVFPEADLRETIDALKYLQTIPVPTDSSDVHEVDGYIVSDDLSASLRSDGIVELLTDHGTAEFPVDELSTVIENLSGLASSPQRSRAGFDRLAQAELFRADDYDRPGGKDQPQTGAMIALVPTTEDAARLALPGGEPVDELHLTLWYLGTAADIPPETQSGLVNAVRSMVERRSLPTVQAQGFGANLWNPTSDDPAWVLAVGDPPQRPEGQESLAVYRTMMDEAWHDGMVPFEPPQQHTPWVPHVCLVYSAEPGLVEQVAARVGPITFDRIRVAFAGQYTDIPLGTTTGQRGYGPGRERGGHVLDNGVCMTCQEREHKFANGICTTCAY